MLGLNVVSVFRSNLKNKVENPTTLKRETEREILIELAIIKPRTDQMVVLECGWRSKGL